MHHPARGRNVSHIRAFHRNIATHYDSNCTEDKLLIVYDRGMIFTSMEVVLQQLQVYCSIPQHHSSMGHLSQYETTLKVKR